MPIKRIERKTVMDLGIFLNPILLESGSINIIWLVLFALVSLALGYFLGGVNCAIVVSRLLYHDDIRKYGSKNAGMTNILRTYGKGAAALTLAGDILKTVIAVLVSRVIFGEPGAYIAGLGSVIGHIYPCYFGFKGGKGVAAVAATILCTNPLCFLILFAVFAVIVIGYKYVSLGSVMCMMLYPVLINRLGGGKVDIITTTCTFLIAALVIFKHKDNIKRLLKGNENKISLSGKKDKKKSYDSPEEKEDGNK